MDTKVVNLKHDPYDVYIGRPGKGEEGYFGNPIRVGEICDICKEIHELPEDTLKCYKKYLWRKVNTDPEFYEKIKELEGKTLGCFCKPNPCHGDIIVNYINAGFPLKEKVEEEPTSLKEIMDNDISTTIENVENDEIKYAVCDTETGGLNANKNALCSIAVVLLDKDFNEIDRFYTLVRDDPDKTIEDQALAVNGLTREEIYEKGMPVKEAIEKVQKMFDGAIPVFHNGAFDSEFINVRGMNVRSCIDTMLLSWKKWPKPQKAKLVIVTERLGFAVEDAHNSLGDVLMTINLLREFAKDPSLDALTPKPIGRNPYR